MFKVFGVPRAPGGLDFGFLANRPMGLPKVFCMLVYEPCRSSCQDCKIGSISCVGTPGLSLEPPGPERSNNKTHTHIAKGRRKYVENM